MSDETKDDGCGADIFCGGPLVFDERIEADVRAGIEAIRARHARVFAESLYTPDIRTLYESDFILLSKKMMISWSESCDPLSWGDPEPDIMAVTRDIARS